MQTPRAPARTHNSAARGFLRTWWAETPNLRLDDRGRLWRAAAWLEDETVLVRAGSIDRPDVPAALEGELAELRDRWRDAFDPRAEAEASYALGLPSAWDLGRR